MTQYKVIKQRPGGPQVDTVGEITSGGYKFIWDAGSINNIGFSFDLEEYFKEIKEESKVPDKWDTFGEKGYYHDGVDMNTLDLSVVQYFDGTYEQLRPTEELADASTAMPKLAQLRNEIWRRCGDWNPDWENEKERYVIVFFGGKIYSDIARSTQWFLSFPTKQVRDEFLEKHRELIEQAKPLL